MNERELTHFFDEIAPTDEQKQKMISQINNNREIIPTKQRKKLIYPCSSNCIELTSFHSCAF